MKLLLLMTIILTSCTPLQTKSWWADQGVDLTTDEATALSEHWNNQDCLPGYVHDLHDRQADQYFECAIKDSAMAYGINVDTWALIAWCESSSSWADNRRLAGVDMYNEASGASGPFQQMPQFWEGRQAASGYYGDIMNPRVNAFVSAWLFATGGPSHWAASRGCHGVG